VVELLEAGVAPCVPQHTLMLPGGFRCWVRSCHRTAPSSKSRGTSVGSSA
jgi:hypothetical protein